MMVAALQVLNRQLVVRPVLRALGRDVFLLSRLVQERLRGRDHNRRLAIRRVQRLLAAQLVAGLRFVLIRRDRAAIDATLDLIYKLRVWWLLGLAPLRPIQHMDL